jgi:hypothetical protein
MAEDAFFGSNGISFKRCCMKCFALLLLFVLAICPNALAIGAIAVDDEAGNRDAGYGLVVGYDSKEEAFKAALAECRQAGNKGCRTVSWFETCGSYATSRNYYGAGWGASRKAAEKMALEACGGGCSIVVSECE